MYFIVAFGGGGLFGYGIFLYRTPQVVIEWQTATEIDTVGFNLYRAEDPQGPFLKINDALIPSSNEPLKGGSYRFVDANVVPNRVYFYQLEDLDLQGKSTKHEPISVQAAPQGQIEMVAGGGIALLGLVLGIWQKTQQNKELDTGDT
ncbi:MAG: hypothetical protein N3D16_07225 [Anaerolineales bacterium]|nr:hypothetical protein [Anaerolineales bacterium]